MRRSRSSAFSDSDSDDSSSGRRSNVVPPALLHRDAVRPELMEAGVEAEAEAEAGAEAEAEAEAETEAEAGAEAGAEAVPVGDTHDQGGGEGSKRVAAAMVTTVVPLRLACQRQRSLAMAYTVGSCPSGDCTQRA